MKNRKKGGNQKKLGTGPFTAAKGTFAAEKAASPWRSRMDKMATHVLRCGKDTFTVGQNFILFPKVVYSCTNSLGTLINY